MSRLLTVAIVLAALLATADVVADRLVRADARAHDVDMERTRAFQDLFFLRALDLQADIRVAALRAHARWTALPATPAASELRVVLIGNSAGIFAVAPGVLARRLESAVPGRTVRVVPLMIPSATIVDQDVLARAALARAPDVIVALIDLDGFQTQAAVASEVIDDLFDSRSGASGILAAIRRGALRHWTLYRTHALLRAIAVEKARSLLPLPGSSERTAILAAFETIVDATRRRDVEALAETYRSISYVPPLRPQFRLPVTEAAAALGAIDVLGRNLAGARSAGVGVVMPFNPLLRGDPVPRNAQDPRASDRAVRDRAREVVDRLRRSGCLAQNRLDALPAEDFIDYVHVNARGMRRFTGNLASILRHVLRRQGRRDRGGTP